jgi:protein O-mannosyl-transferase
MAQADSSHLRPIHYIILGGILFLTLITYLPALSNGFSNLDDTSYIVKNELIKELSLPSLAKIFSSFTVGMYNPFTNLTFALEYHFFGMNPFAFHLTNVILHLLNTCLVFLFVYSLSRKPLAALFVGIFFGAHPMHVESVAWITERKDVLFFFFYMTGLIFYLKATERNKLATLNRLLILTVFALALFSKPTAVSFPLVLLLIDYFRGRTFSKELVVEKLPFFLLSFVFGVIALISVRTPFMPYEMIPADRVYLSMLERVICSCHALWDYVLKAFLPLQLSVFYPYPMVGKVAKLSWIYYLSIVGCISLAWLMLRAFRINKVFVFGMTFFIATIFFNLPLMTVGYSFGGDRFTYLPYLGIFFIVGHYFEDFYSQRSMTIRRMQYWVGAALSGLIVLFSILTLQRCTMWKDAQTLWHDVIKKFPKHPLGYDNLAGSYFDQRDYEAVVLYSNAALALNPEYYTAHYRKGTVYLLTGNLQAALEEYDQAIKTFPRFYHAILGRGIVHYFMGASALALQDFNLALIIYPDNMTVLTNRGTIYFEQNQLDKALADYSTILRLDPKNAVAQDTVNMIKERIRVSEAQGQCTVSDQL